MIKKNLRLIEDKPNVFDFPQSTIDTYKVDESEKEVFKSTVSLFLSKSKDHFSYKHIKFHVDNNFNHIDIIKMTQYPLVSVFNTSTKRIIINLSALEKRSISNIEPRDLYCILLYAHVCGFLSSKDRIPTSTYPLFCDYMTSLFLKTFAKKYGITGSYASLIPKLRFLVSLYIQRCFFDIDENKALVQSANISKYNYKKMLDIKLGDYDFQKIDGLIKSLDDSQTLPGIGIYRFIDMMVRSFGVINICMYEDLMRFCSSLAASSVNGNSYFSPAYQMFQPKVFLKIISTIDSAIPVK